MTIRNAGQSAVESYLAFFARNSPGDVQYAFRAAAKPFFAWLEAADIALAAVQAGHINQFFYGSKWRPSTLRSYFAALRRLFAHFESDRIIDRSPFSELPIPRCQKHENMEKLNAFLEELDGITKGSDWYRPGLVAMYPLVTGEMDLTEIARDTDIPLDEVETYANRLRQNGIWLASGQAGVASDPHEDFGAFAVEMVLNIGCAAGVFERCADADDITGPAPEALEPSATSPGPR